MHEHSGFGKLSDKSADKTLDVLFANANPNSERVGCPSRSVLKRLARREVPIGDPRYDHLAQCSPCYCEFRALQSQPGENANRARILVPVAAVAIAVVSITSYWASHRQEQPVHVSNNPAVVASMQPSRPQVVDLAALVTTRGGKQTPAAPTIVLTKPRTDLTLLLPVGWETGRYLITLSGKDGRTVIDNVADASNVDHRTTLRIGLDLGTLHGDTFRLKLQHQGESGSAEIPVIVQ